MKLMHQAHQLSVDLEQARETIVLKNKENLKVQWIMSVNSTVLTLMSLWAHETTTGTADTAEKMNDNWFLFYCASFLRHLVEVCWNKNTYNPWRKYSLPGPNSSYSMHTVLNLSLKIKTSQQFTASEPTNCFTVNEPELTVNLLQLWGSNTAVWLRPA